MIFARQALLATGWATNVRLETENEHITKITSNARRNQGDFSVDTLLPALGNLHSHSFQRAMAGMTEYRLAGRESFWTWRDLMYRFTAHLTPEQIEAIAALVFLEMQEAGYASVGEFHYIHHQNGGELYSDIAELTNRTFAAASETGIGLTHLPVLYTYGGVNEAPLEDGQLRFGNSVDQFKQLLARARGGKVFSSCQQIVVWESRRIRCARLRRLILPPFWTHRMADRCIYILQSNPKKLRTYAPALVHDPWNGCLRISTWIPTGA